MTGNTMVLASWVTSPYTSYDKRHIKVEHRVRVIEYSGGFGDVQHERRINGRGETDDWKAVERIELREHGMHRQKVRPGVLEE